jgi:hypothetical protein
MRFKTQRFDPLTDLTHYDLFGDGSEIMTVFILGVLCWSLLKFDKKAV